MHTLEDATHHLSMQMPIIFFTFLQQTNIYIFRANNHIHFGVLAKTFVNALKVVFAEVYHTVFHHGGIQDVTLANKVRYEAVLWFVVYVSRCANLLDLTLAHHYHAIAQCQRLLLVVRHVDKRDTQLLVHRTKLHLHILAHLQVQRSQWLVQEQYLWLVDDSTRNRYTLLLTARQTVHITVLIVRHTNRLQRLLHLLLNHLLVNLLELQTKSYIVEDIQMREKGILLKHGVHVTHVRRHLRHVLAVQQDITFGGYLKTCDTTQQGRLATTRWA